MAKHMTASHGRPGPVVVDIPKDVQFATGAYAFERNIQHKTYQPRLKGDPERVRYAGVGGLQLHKRLTRFARRAGPSGGKPSLDRGRDS
jgi:glyoxylate carboligase